MDQLRKVLNLDALRFRNDYFIFLLPLFFVLHGYNEYYGMVPVSEAFLLLFQYELWIGVFSLLFFFVFRTFRKAVLLSFALGCFYFFFGAAHDWLKEVVPGTVLVKYSFILPSVLLVFVVLFIYLKKTGRSFHRLVKYLNILFLCLVGVDAIFLLFKELPHKEIVQQATVDSQVRGSLKPCDTCIREDIHLIVLDEYAGKAQLKEEFNFNNTPFLDSLHKRGFRIIEEASSNYNYTSVSIASMLSLDYLPGLGKWPPHELINIGDSIVNKSVFIEFLMRQGYEINNISVFDIQNIPAYKDEFGYMLNLITDQTFWNRLKKDIGYHLLTTLNWERAIKKVIEGMEYHAAENENQIGITLNRVKSKESRPPQFYYTHLMMPHQPFVLDRNGRSVGLTYYQDPDQVRGFKRGYLEYLQYTNKRMLAFVDALMKSSSRPPIIILMSDHGFRHPTVEEKYHFMTLNAVFFPNRRYEGFYDGMSNVNQMRVLLNNRFRQQLPILKDSTAFLGWPGM